VCPADRCEALHRVSCNGNAREKRDAQQQMHGLEPQTLEAVTQAPIELREERTTVIDPITRKRLR